MAMEGFNGTKREPIIRLRFDRLGVLGLIFRFEARSGGLAIDC